MGGSRKLIARVACPVGGQSCVHASRRRCCGPAQLWCKPCREPRDNIKACPDIVRLGPDEAPTRLHYTSFVPRYVHEAQLRSIERHDRPRQRNGVLSEPELGLPHVAVRICYGALWSRSRLQHRTHVGVDAAMVCISEHSGEKQLCIGSAVARRMKPQRLARVHGNAEYQ